MATVEMTEGEANAIREFIDWCIESFFIETALTAAQLFDLYNESRKD